MNGKTHYGLVAGLAMTTGVIVGVGLTLLFISHSISNTPQPQRRQPRMTRRTRKAMPSDNTPQTKGSTASKRTVRVKRPRKRPGETK